MNCFMKKIEKVFIDEMKEALSTIREEIQFIDRTARYGIIEVQLSNEASTKKYSLMNIKTEKCWCFSVYLGRQMARIQIGTIHPDIKTDWVVAAITKEIELKYEIVNSNKTKIINWWGYGLEIFATLSEADYRELPYVIFMYEQKIKHCYWRENPIMLHIR